MRLIAHAAVQGNLAQGRRCREHEALSELDAPVSDPDARRYAESPLERAAEVPDADVE